MAKTPTPAQLAARERFAAMARAGAFKRKTGGAKRKTNPDYPGRMSVDAHGIVGVSPDVTVELEDTRNGQRRSFTSEFFVDRDSIDPGWFVWGRWGGVGRGVGVVKRVAWPAGPMRKWPKITRLVQPGFRTKADAQLVADQLAAEFIRRANPLTRVKVKSPSMATGAPPSKRLTKRRKATAKAPQGYYANPVKFQHSVHAADRMDNVVQARHGRAWSDVARFVDFNTAKQYAQAYADAHNVQVKVLGNFGDKYKKARA